MLGCQFFVVGLDDCVDVGENVFAETADVGFADIVGSDWNECIIGCLFFSVMYLLAYFFVVGPLPLDVISQVLVLFTQYLLSRVLASLELINHRPHLLILHLHLLPFFTPAIHPQLMILLDERPHLQTQILQNALSLLLILMLPLKDMSDVLFIDSSVLVQVHPQFLCLLVEPEEFKVIGVIVSGKRGIMGCEE